MQHLRRPIFDLLRCELEEETIASVVRLVRAGPSVALTSTLKGLKIPEQLKHDLWAMGQGVEDVPPISDNAAREIFREVLREYQAFNELGPKERRGVIQDFLLSVESQCRMAITCEFEEFRKAVLEAEKMGKAWDPQVLACGRYFCASGVWPVTAIGVEGR